MPRCCEVVLEARSIQRIHSFHFRLPFDILPPTSVGPCHIAAMAFEVDIESLSAFSSVPQTDISTLLTQPTVDLVTSFLGSISQRAKDCEQVKSQKVRLEVELEQSVRTRESKVKLFKNSAEKALAEVSKLRADLQASGWCEPCMEKVFADRRQRMPKPN